jgi:sugar phosphate isomerase/epimerase
MNNCENLTRRSFVALATAGLAAPQAALGAAKKVPVGLELYSVRNALKANLMTTLDGVAKMGYQVVEFYAPYYEWTPAYAKEVRAKLDDLGMRCYSTHNGMASFSPGDGIGKAIELNNILGSHYIVMASAGRVNGADGWKRVADILNVANTRMKANKLHTGYHNHAAEWKAVDGKVPMEILAAGTDKTVMLQFDVGTALEEGRDPVAWINSNPGRIRSLHLKEWNKAKGYKCLLGEGDGPWKKIFAAAEKKGGVEYYLIEQEGSEFPEMDTAAKCLAAYKKLHA